MKLALAHRSHFGSAVVGLSLFMLRAIVAIGEVTAATPRDAGTPVRPSAAGLTSDAQAGAGDAGGKDAAVPCVFTLGGGAAGQGVCNLTYTLSMANQADYWWRIDFNLPRWVPAYPSRLVLGPISLPEKPPIGKEQVNTFGSIQQNGVEWQVDAWSSATPIGRSTINVTAAKFRQQGFIRSLELHGALDIRMEAVADAGTDAERPPDAFLHVRF